MVIIVHSAESEGSIAANGHIGGTSQYGQGAGGSIWPSSSTAGPSVYGLSGTRPIHSSSLGFPARGTRWWTAWACWRVTWCY